MLETEIKELMTEADKITIPEVRRRAFQEIDAIERDAQTLERAITLCRIKGETGILSHYGSFLESAIGINGDIWAGITIKEAPEQIKVTKATSKITDRILDEVEKLVDDGLRKNCGCRTAV